MNEHSLHEWIDRYLNGELSGKELKEFHAKLSADAQFFREVKIQRAANNIILDNKLIELKAKIRNDYYNKPSGGSFLKNGLIIGTGILLISGAGYWFINKKDESGKAEAISKPFVAETNSPKSERISQKEITDSEKQKTGFSSNSPLSTNLPEKKGKVSKKDKEVIWETAKEESVTKEMAKAHTPEPEVAKKEEAHKTAIPNEAKKTDPCKTASLKATFKITAACEGSSNGRIEIETGSIKGGKQPYGYSLNGKAYTTRTIYPEMNAGTYAVIIKDANECKDTLEAIVPVKKCSEFKQYSFNPDRESWKFPIETSDEGTIHIADKSGVTVFTSEISFGQVTEWNGKKNDGSDLGTGAYYFVIELKNGKVINGYITLIR